MSSIYARTTPLAILLILAVTVVPAGFRLPSTAFVANVFIPWQILANFILFFPLGLCLQGGGLWRAAYRGAALSLAVETVQFFLVSRNPEPADLIANTLGALCGAAAGRRLSLWFGWSFNRLRLGRASALGAAFILIVLSGTFLYRASLWTWDHSHRLAVGAELTGDRTWDGEILEMAIFDSQLDPLLIRKLADEGPGSIAANRALLPKAPVFEQTAPLTSEGERGRPLLQGEDSRKFFDALVGAGEFAVLAWCRTDRLDQFRDARIVTYSQHTMRRNFTLGQEGRRVFFRVRTLVSGLNATRFVATTPPLLEEGLYTLLAAGYDGRTSRIYVNGQLATEQDLTDGRLFWGLWSPDLIPGILALLGALLAVVFLGFGRPPSRWLQWSAAGLAGVVAGLFFLVTGGAQEHSLGAFVALLAPAGALILLLRDGSGVPDQPTAAPRKEVQR